MEKLKSEMDDLKQQRNENKDEVKSSWHCDIYCRKVRHVACEGKSGIDPDSPNVCPYLDEMLY